MKMVQKDVFIYILKFINVGNLKKNTHCTLYVLCILVSFMFSYYYNFVRGWRKCDAFSSIFETCYLYKGLLKGKNSDVVVFLSVENMYVYEGRDYSKETTDRDQQAFDNMVAGEEVLFKNFCFKS